MPRRRESGTVDGVFDYGVTVEGPVDATSDVPQEAVDAAVEAIEEVVEEARDPKGSTDEDGEDEAGADE